MDEDVGIVELECPACGEEDQHVLRAAASGWTLSCSRCKLVRTVPAPPQQRWTTIPVIISEGADARRSQIAVPLEEEVMVGDEVDHEGLRLRVTGLEFADGLRRSKGLGRDLRVLHAVRFDTVRLAYSVNQGDVTHSYTEDVDPDQAIEIGEVREVQGVRLVVKTMKSDQNRTLHNGFLLARNIRRLFADPAPTGAKPGQRRRTRARGADPKAKARGKVKRSVGKPAPRQPRRSRRA